MDKVPSRLSSYLHKPRSQLLPQTERTHGAQCQVPFDVRASDPHCEFGVQAFCSGRQVISKNHPYRGFFTSLCYVGSGLPPDPRLFRLKSKISPPPSRFRQPREGDALIVDPPVQLSFANF